MGNKIIFNRVWAMPNSSTFNIKPINQFVHFHCKGQKIILDSFSKDSMIGTIRNDLDPKTKAEFHMDVLDFLNKMAEDKIIADLILWDPPYSPRQLKECYNGTGRNMTLEDGWRTHWTKERDIMNRLVHLGSKCLSFGWNSVGMGQERGWRLDEILLVSHGSGHNDTICIAETKVKLNSTKPMF